MGLFNISELMPGIYFQTILRIFRSYANYKYDKKNEPSRRLVALFLPQIYNLFLTYGVNILYIP